MAHHNAFSITARPFKPLLAIGLVAVAALLLVAAPRPSQASTCRPSPATAASPPAETSKLKRIVYLHGRGMRTWPSAALLGASSQWSHQWVPFNGSARLTETATRNAVKNAIKTNCRAPYTQCVIVCYSAGCARALLAIDDLDKAGTPPNKLAWIQAHGSAAGGSELADFLTKNNISLWVKLFGKIVNFVANYFLPGYGWVFEKVVVYGTTQVPNPEAIDKDLKVNSMRNTYAYIQDVAPVPVYHVAGSKNICKSVRIAFIFKVKVCGNSYFPGKKGDGAIAVHSAAGYRNVGAYSSHHTGAAKYVNRAYEQVALFNNDHFSIFGPGTFLGSLRLAVNKNLTCAGAPAVPSEFSAEASITYEDADQTTVTETTPLAALKICGNDVFNGQDAEYQTCADGCCDYLSAGGAVSGCTCGEALCRQPLDTGKSYYAHGNCYGQEYIKPNEAPCGFDGILRTWDGHGMVGSIIVDHATYRSWRGEDGECFNFDCPKSLSNVLKVYRTAGQGDPTLPPVDHGGCGNK